MKPKIFYSVAIVSKYDMVKAFICSFPNWERLQDQIEEVVAQNVLISNGDVATCKITVHKESIHERMWTLAGNVSTKEKCWSGGRNTYLYQSFEAHVIKSVHRPHPALPHISLWCGTCVQRAKAGRIDNPILETQYFLDGEKTRTTASYESKSDRKGDVNFRTGRNINIKTKPPQKIGVTKYNVKLIHISSGYNI